MESLSAAAIFLNADTQSLISKKLG